MVYRYEGNDNRYKKFNTKFTTPENMKGVYEVTRKEVFLIVYISKMKINR